MVSEPIDKVAHDCHCLLKAPKFPLLDPKDSSHLEEAVREAGATEDLEQALCLLDRIVSRYQRVFLLVDRSDRIWGRKWMSELAKHLKRAGCVVQVLLIASSEHYDSAGLKLSSDIVETLREILRSCFHVIDKDN